MCFCLVYHIKLNNETTLQELTMKKEAQKTMTGSLLQITLPTTTLLVCPSRTFLKCCLGMHIACEKKKPLKTTTTIHNSPPHDVIQSLSHKFTPIHLSLLIFFAQDEAVKDSKKSHS